MYDLKTATQSFNPNKPIRQIANFMRAQIAGQGLEKSLVFKSLELKTRLDESGYGFLIALDILAMPNNLAQVIPVVIYLDGNGYGDKSLNELFSLIGQYTLEGSVSYKLDLVG